MVKDPEGIYHYTEGYLDKEGEPIFSTPTYCGIDWEDKEGWWIVYLLDINQYSHLICDKCISDQERRLTDK
jgi:hypothetical protein